jgi:hypothetical protein
MSHSRAVRSLAVFPALVLSLAAATAQAQTPTPPAAEQPAAPPPGAQPLPGAEPLPGYQPPPGAPAYGAPPAGYAQPIPGQPSYFNPPPVAYMAPQNLHDGFYLRLHLGGSYLRVSDGNNTLSGPGASLGVALGGVVAPNLIIYGTFYGVSVSDPTLDVSGGGSGTLNGLSLTMIGFGGGLAYYLPNNVYISGTLATTQFSLSETDNNNNSADSKWGFGVQGLVGKEWWVSQDWGIGVAGEVLASSMKDETDESWTGLSFGLLFSATYN